MTPGVSRSPNPKLAAALDQAGFSRAGLARRVVELAALRGVDRRYTHIDVARWLDGVQPSGIVPGVIAEVFAAKLGRPVTTTDLGLASGDGLQLVRAASYHESLDDTVDALIALTTLDNGVSSARELIDASMWSEVMVQWLLAPDCPPPLSSDWDDGPARAMQWARVMFSQVDNEFGGGYARSSLVEFIRAEVAPLLRRPGGVPVSLLQPAAALLRLAGWTAYDTGHQTLAAGYLTQALRLAQQAGDRELGGMILANLSHQAHFLGQNTQAIRLAQAAQQGARGQVSATAMAIFCSMEARGRAALGDRRGVEQSRAQAESWFERRSIENDSQWVRYFNAAELAAEFAHCYRDLGVANAAAELGRLAVSEADPRYRRSIAFATFVRAAGLVRGGSVDEGLAAARVAMETSASLRSTRLRAYADEFVVTLRECSGDDCAEGRAFLDEFRAPVL